MPQFLKSTVATILLTAPNALAQLDDPSRMPRSLLLDAVPSCSSTCLDAFISTNYPPSLCPDRNNLSCLCRTTSTSGYTIGEAALRCVLSFCSNPQDSDFLVYNICYTVDGAAPNTHSVLTATVMETVTGSATRSPPSTSVLKVTSLSTPASSGWTTSISVASTTTASTMANQVTSSLTGPQVTQSSSQASSTAANPHLNSTQTIGISVGVGVTAVCLIGLVIALILRRRKKERLENRGQPFFEIGGSMPEPSPTRPYSPGDYGREPIVKTPIGLYNEPIAERLTPKNNPRIQFPAVDTSPSRYDYDPDEKTLEGTPVSIHSRTPSQLLPEKPEYDVFSAPHLSSNRAPGRPQSSTTLFEEDSDSRRLFASPVESYSRTLQFGNPHGLVERQQDVHSYSSPLDSRIRSHQYNQFLSPHIPKQPAHIYANGRIDRTYGASNGRPVQPRPVEFGPSIRAMNTTAKGTSNSYRQNLRNANGTRRVYDYEPLIHDRRHSTNSATSFETALSDDWDIPGHKQKRLRVINETPSPHLRSSSDPKHSKYPAIPKSASVRGHRTVSSPHITHYRIHPFSPQILPQDTKSPPTTSSPSLPSRPNRAYRYPNTTPPLRQGQTPSTPVERMRASPRIGVQKGREEPRTYPSPSWIPQTDHSDTAHDSNSSLLVKRRGELVADKMESEIDASFTSRRKPSPPNDDYPPPLRVENKTPPRRTKPRGPGLPPHVKASPSPPLQQVPYSQRTPTRQHYRKDRAASCSEDDTSNAGSMRGRKLTPTKRGPDLYLSVE